MIGLEVEGVDALQEKLRRAGQKASAGVARAVTATALLVRADVQERIQRGPKTGRVYVRGAGRNLSREHQASAEGEAPATDTGVLVGSIYFEQTRPLTAVVGSRLAYAHYLEFGTARMAPRPSWQPAVDKMRPELARRVEKALKEAMK